MDQGQKHWIQAILGEDPYLPYPYNYDVVQWSYPLTRGIAGSGFLTQPFPPGVTMTEITDPDYGTVTGAGSAVYAFDTDSAQGLGMVMELLDKNVQVSRAAAGFDRRRAHVQDRRGAGRRLDARRRPTWRRSRRRGRRRSRACRASRSSATCCRSRRSASSAARRPIPPTRSSSAAAAKNSCSGSFCESLFVLTQKMKIPASLIHPITATDLAAGRLVTDQFTAFINPGVSLALTGAS